MANRFYVGGTSSSWSTSGTSVWSTTSGGVGGASVPSSLDSVFFDRAGTYNITCSAGVNCLDITVSAGTCNFSGSSILIYGSMSLIAGTTWSYTGYTQFSATTGKTINTGGISLSALYFAGIGGSWSLTNSLTTTNILLGSGTIILNGFDISCTNFNSNVSTARGVNFGSNYITLRDTFAADIPLEVSTATNFTYTGPGGFASSAALTRTFKFGTTAGGASGSNSSYPSLKFTGTASAALTVSGSYNILDFGTTTSTVISSGGSIKVNTLILSAGGTYTSVGITYYGGPTGAFTLNGKSLSSVIAYYGLTLTETLNTTGYGYLYKGTLNLNGFDWICSGFDSGGFTPLGSPQIRQINFGNNYIVMTGNTAGSITLNMIDLTNFTFTDTGGGFSTEIANQTRSFNQGTTGGTATNAPSLRFTGSGALVATIVTGSWFKNLDFGVTQCSVVNYPSGVTTLNISGNLTFSSAGSSSIYSYVSINMIGTGNRTFISNNKGFAGLTVNTTTGTVTLGSACQVAYSPGTYTQTSGTLDCNGFYFQAVNVSFNSGSIINYTAGMTFYTSVAVNMTMTIATIGTITSNNCTWTIASGVTLTFSSGTINALNMSFTSATFNVSSGAILTIGGTLTQTLSNINFNGTISNSTTGTWSLVSGNLVLTTNPIVIGRFLSTGTATRSINFGTSGYISTTITGTSVTALDLGGTGLTLVGTTKFNYAGTPTALHQIIINTGTFIEASAFDLSVVSAINTNTGLNIVDTGIAAYFFISGSIANCDFTGMNFIYQPGTLTVYKDYTIPATGGTVSGGNLVTFASTSATARTVTISRTVDFPLTFSGVGGTFNLGTSLTTGSTRTTTLLAGTLNLNNNSISTGIFASTGTLARTIVFGTNNITLSSTVAATTVLAMADATNFTNTGTGGFTTDLAIAKTFTFGNTGGSVTNAPNLFLTSGAAIPTITTGSWFNILDFTGTTSTPATTNVNVSILILAAGGTYTSFTPTFTNTQTWLGQFSKQLGGLGVNIPGGTLTLGGAQSLIATATVTLTAGTLDLGSFNLTTGIFSSNNTNTRAISFGSSNIILAHTTAGTTVLNMATLTGFTLSGSGGFTSAMSINRTFTSGTTGGSVTNAPNLFLTSGGSTPTITTGSWFNTLDFTGSTSIPATTNVNVSTLVLATDGIYTSFTPTFTRTQTWSGQFSKQLGGLGINIPGGTFTMTEAITLPVNATTTLVAGTLYLKTSPTSGGNLSTGIFSSNNSNVRGVILERNIVITHTTPGTTVIDMANATNFSYTEAAPGVAFFSDGLITRTYNCGTTGTPNPVNTPHLRLSGGNSSTAIATFVTGSYFSQLDIGYYYGTPAVATLNLGGFTEWLKVGSANFSNLTINITGNGYISNSNNNSTFPALNINNYPYVVKCIDTSTYPRGFTLTSGTLGLNGYACTIPTLTSTGTLTREINGDTIYIPDLYNVPYNSPSRSDLQLSGAGTAFSNTSATGLTLKNFRLGFSNSLAKTFAGGGVYAPTMTLAHGDGAALTITGNNTFKDLDFGLGRTFTIQAGSTQTFSNFTLRGYSNNSITLNSTIAGTKYNLVVRPGGPVNVNYLNFQDCNATRYPAVTGTAAMLMYAGANSTSVSNNTGWIFTAGPTNNSSMLRMFF